MVELKNNTEECKYTVYMHRNKINNKVYIGQTRTRVNVRWNNGHGYKGCTLFERAIQKYGWGNFDHIILAENLSKEESCKMEKDLIALYDSTNPQHGYNLSAGGESGHFGVKLSNEVRERISKANKGKIVTLETCQKISSSLKGKKLSELAYKKAIEAHNVEVVQLTKSGEYINTYPSIAEASRQTGINVSTISSCCNRRNHNKSAGGFLWTYLDNYNNNGVECYKNDHIKSIVQLDMDGKYVEEFASCVEAGNALNKRPGAINQCLNGAVKSAYGFIWVYKNNYNPNIDYSYKRDKYANQYAVYQLDKCGNIIDEFDSVMCAHLTTGINYSCICACCNGTQKTAGGFVWKKKDLNN